MKGNVALGGLRSHVHLAPCQMWRVYTTVAAHMQVCSHLQEYL